MYHRNLIALASLRWGFCFLLQFFLFAFELLDAFFWGGKILRHRAAELFDSLSYFLPDFKMSFVCIILSLYAGSAEEVGQFFDQGNIQSARTNALSYAARLVATSIAETLTNG